jgi:hypothetical protein
MGDAEADVDMGDDQPQPPGDDPGWRTVHRGRGKGAGPPDQAAGGKGHGKGATKGKMPIIPVPAPAPQKDPPRPLYGKPNETQYDQIFGRGAWRRAGSYTSRVRIVEPGCPQ